MLRSSPWIFRTLLCCALAPLLYFSAITYSSDFHLAQADRGNKTLEEYGKHIERAAGSTDSAAHKYAVFLAEKESPAAAYRYLRQSPAGAYDWRGWELCGQLLERMAFSTSGSLNQAHEASAYYDKVLRVYPSNTRVLQRAAVLSLKMGDFAAAQRYADELAKFYPASGDANYIKAEASQASGNTTRSIELLERLSARNHDTTGSLFRLSHVRERLKLLKGSSR